MRVAWSHKLTGPQVRYAGAGPAGSGLFWWLTDSGPDGRPVVTAARCTVDGVARLGTIEPGRIGPWPRFSRDGTTLLMASAGRLHRLRLDGQSAVAAEVLALGESAVSDLDSADGNTLFLARSLEWPPIRRLNLISGGVSDLEGPDLGAGLHHPMLALNAGGTRVGFGHVFDGIAIIDPASGRSSAWPAEQAPPVAPRNSHLVARLDFTEDGSLLAVSNPRRAGEGPYVLRVGDLSGYGLVNHPLTDHHPVVAVSAAGRFAAAPRRGAPSRVEVFEPGSGTTLDGLDVGSDVRALVFESTPAGLLTVVHSSGVAVLAVDHLA